MFLPSRSIAWQRGRPTGGGTRPGFNGSNDHIGPIDSVMPEKTHSEGPQFYAAGCGCTADK